MSSIKIVKEKDELTRVTWETKISGDEKKEIVIDRPSSVQADRLKVVCSYKLISGNLTTGPCKFNVWLYLTVEKSSRNDDCVLKYCQRPFSVSGDVRNHPVGNKVCDYYSSDKQIAKIFFKKTFAPNYWSSETLTVKFPVQPTRRNNEHDVVGAKQPYINTLILTFEIIIQFEISVCQSEINLVKQLTGLFVDQQNCDVQFFFENDFEIGGHIAILSARSPVFAAMFQNDMKENQEREVDITDVKFEIFEQLLHFIYSGRLDKPLREEDSQPLYAAADKYDIVDLKEECISFILSRLRVENCVNLLAWAHLHSIERIKEEAMDFVALHGKEVCILDDWANLMKNYPDLCLIASRRMMDNMCLVSSTPKLL